MNNSNSDVFVNYHNSFKNFVAAIAKNNHFLLIEHLESPFKRLDGRRVSYQVEYRELSIMAQNEDDEAWCRVKSNDFMYWSERELLQIGIKPKSKAQPDLQEVFNNITIM